MSLYLCVDCGASKTSAVICNSSGAIIGRSLSGPSNFAYLGLEAFTLAVQDAVCTALQTCSSHSAALSHSHSFDCAWLGISGVDSPAAIETITPVLSKLLGIPVGPKLMITNDTHLLAAPVRRYPDISHAVAVIAGTGSNCVSLSYDNSTLRELGRTGGWGWVLGDEGGGYHVGREAIRQILLETDLSSVGCPLVVNGTLKGKVFETFGVKDALEILSIIHLPDPVPGATVATDAPAYVSMPREKRLSSLCPLVFASAFEERDPLALNILHTCAKLLASQIILLLQSLVDDRQFSTKTVKAQDSVICFGGSLAGVEAYRKLILGALEESGHVFRYVEFVDDPAAIGAAGLASAA